MTGIKVGDIDRDNRISAEMDIDPVYVNYIGKAIRRDPRYIWEHQELERLGVLGLEWNTVTNEHVKELARKLYESGK